MLHQFFRAQPQVAAGPSAPPSIIQHTDSYKSSSGTHISTLPAVTQADSTLLYCWVARTQNPNREITNLVTDQAQNFALLDENILHARYRMQIWQLFNATAGTQTITASITFGSEAFDCLIEIEKSTLEKYDLNLVETTSHSTVEHAATPQTSAGPALGIAFRNFDSNPNTLTEPSDWTRLMDFTLTCECIYREEPTQFVSEVAQATGLGISRRYQTFLGFYISA